MTAFVSPISTVASLDEELSAAGEGLSGNADVLRGVLAGCGDCIKILDLDGRLQFMSEGGKRVMDVEDFSAVKGCPWPDFGPVPATPRQRMRSRPRGKATSRDLGAPPTPRREIPDIGTYRCRRSSATMASLRIFFQSRAT
jgi:hypothetical protein